MKLVNLGNAREFEVTLAELKAANPDDVFTEDDRVYVDMDEFDWLRGIIMEDRMAAAKTKER